MNGIAMRRTTRSGRQPVLQLHEETLDAARAELGGRHLERRPSVEHRVRLIHEGARVNRVFPHLLGERHQARDSLDLFTLPGLETRAPRSRGPGNEAVLERGRGSRAIADVLSRLVQRSNGEPLGDYLLQVDEARNVVSE